MAAIPQAQEPQPRLRLFYALDLPDDVRDEIAAWSARELRDDALRPVPAESLHLTLCFLGSTPREQLADAERQLQRLRPRRVPLALRCEVVAKPPRRPGLFALEAESQEAVELQGKLASALAAAGLYEPERRPFWPHVTVARVRAERGGKRLRRVVRRPGPLPEDLVRTFASVRVALYRSNLRPEGARYARLANLDLPR